MLIAARTPSLVPTTNSVDPPPRSTTRTFSVSAGGLTDTAPAKLKAASSEPSITSGVTPRRVRTPSMNSSRLPASRVAEVATNLTCWAPCLPMSAAYSSTAVKVRSRASGTKFPVASTPWPKRTIRIWRDTSSSRVCPSSSSMTSAMSNRMEFVPQSMAATLMLGLLCRVLRDAARSFQPVRAPVGQHCAGPSSRQGPRLVF